MPFRALLPFCFFLFFQAAAWPAGAFDLDDIDREARARLAQPWQAESALGQTIGYDAWRDLRFRRDKALWHADRLAWEAQFFPTGGASPSAVEVFEVVAGKVRPLTITRGDFVRGAAVPSDDPAAASLAGVRLLHPMNKPDHFDEVIAFLGASYFRALGAGQQYGSSARGLALDTTGGRPEEFPRFIRFWLERPSVGAGTTATVYALLDSARATGAYRFDIRPGTTTEVDVQARIYLRAPVTTFGMAPLTSMFFSGENQPVANDFRPEVHDADGLQIAADNGEWLWRPLTRPRAPFVTSFAMRTLRGFGLMQRDRRFASYEDLESHYQRRPSVWVEPIGDWGPGRIELLQLPAATEVEDNIVAFWVPATPPQPGQALALAWRISWAGDQSPGTLAGRVTQTRLGFGYQGEARPKDQMQFHVDFSGDTLSALPRDSQVSAVVSGDGNTRVLATRTESLPATGGWRMTLDIQRLDATKPLELRAFLRNGSDTLTETWTYALAPE